MEIRVLRYFLTVVQEGSITQAAKALHVTQPTLSRQLMELEEELGQQLFIRGSRRISLTEEGLLLRQRAEEILSLIDKTTTEFSAMDDASIRGEVRIGCGEGEPIRFIARTLTAMRRSYPFIQTHFYSGNAPDVLDKLDKGLTDFAVVFGPLDLTPYHYLRLPGAHHWGLLMPKGCPLSQKGTISPADLLSLPLICSAQALEQNEFAGWLGVPVEQLHIVAIYNLFYNASLLVQEGLGYATSFDNLAPTGPASLLCHRPFHPPLQAIPYLLWKKSHRFSKASRIFLEAYPQRFNGHLIRHVISNSSKSSLCPIIRTQGGFFILSEKLWLCV